MRDLLDLQHGVVARRQLADVGLTENDVRRLLRRRELVPLHPGVYVDHTGPPTWLQRAWGGVLLGWPAALAGASALRADDGPGRWRDDTVLVAIEHGRTVQDRPGVRFQRVVDLDARVRWNLAPPRVRYEDASLDVAAEARSRTAALGVLAAGLQARRTTPSRLADALAARPRFAQRVWFAAVLDDLAAGACSVLEHGYLTRVERPHRLPRGERQVRAHASTGVVYRDATYPGGVVLELDGRLFHDTADARDRDMERDLDAALDGLQTRRLSYGQVFDRPCATAAKVGRLLRLAGWHGTAAACSPTCAVRRAA